jgi:alpha-glucan,water dikinase
LQDYWRTLGAAGISAERLASFDRAIRSEPHFNAQQVPRLRRDLTAYLRTLK